MAPICFFDKKNIDSLPWPKTSHGQLAEDYLKPLIKEGPEHYFLNVATTMQAMLVDDCVIPITINEKVENNAYVCSSYTHYVNYAWNEVDRVSNPLSRATFKGMIQFLGMLFQWGEIDKTVFVNNWLLPTNLYPSLTPKQVKSITQTLIKTYPQHTIAFRSVNFLHPRGLPETLTELGYDLLLCRDIYYTDAKNDSAPYKARMTKSDLKLLKNTPYKILQDKEISMEATGRIADLYRMLNIEKHSPWNPRYSDHWIGLIRESSSFVLNAFEKQGKINAVIAYYTQNGVMTSPLFGYDTTHPQSEGLYRQISALLLKEAKEEGVLLHQSSGAGHFKTLRRAKKGFEYTGIYHKHLPFRRRIPWIILLYGMNRLGKAFLDYNTTPL